MDYNRIMSMVLVSDRTENIEARYGCIKLKGVLHHYIYDNGYHSDMVEMTAPYPGKKRALFEHGVNVVKDDENYTPEAIALKKIYKQELEIRRRQRYLERNKKKIAELLPIWFKYDALMGYFDAIERLECRKLTRQARRGEILRKEINKNLSAIRKRLDNDREDAKHVYTKDANRALHIAGFENLELYYGDACRLCGDNIWEQLLMRTEHTADVVDDDWRSLFKDFAFLYNIELSKFEKGDIVETIGFGDKYIAATLYRNGEVVAVGAIDDTRGRKALRVLVGDKRLAELLPKKVYNAITRQEQFYIRGSLSYRRINRHQMITIQ